MATAVLASHQGGDTTAVRQRVQAAIQVALQGVEVVEVPVGTSADEMLEQVGLHASMEFMINTLQVAKELR